ncbi:MAG: V4R domain-containing protein [Promethearchaeota archaeon]
MKLILSFFDKFFGPKIFHSIPNDIGDNFKNLIFNFMSLRHKEKYFEFKIPDNKKMLFIYNFLFNIDSDLARGGEEVLLLSVIFSKERNSEYMQFIFKKIENEFKKNKLIFYGLYSDLSQEEEEVNKQYKNILKILDKAYKILKHKIEKEKIIKNIFREFNLDDISDTSSLLKMMARIFITTIDATIPKGAIILYDIGTIIGKQIVGILKSNSTEELIAELSNFWKKHNFGEIDEVQIIGQQINFKVYDCFECKHYSNINMTVCRFDEGVISEILTQKLKKKYYVKEIQCFGTGKNYCEFLVGLKPEYKLK